MTATIDPRAVRARLQPWPNRLGWDLEGTDGEVEAMQQYAKVVACWRGYIHHTRRELEARGMTANGLAVTLPGEGVDLAAAAVAMLLDEVHAAGFEV